VGAEIVDAGIDARLLREELANILAAANVFVIFAAAPTVTKRYSSPGQATEPHTTLRALSDSARSPLLKLPMTAPCDRLRSSFLAAH
jgi:hypothetical protein